jgi:phytoene synthase
MLLPGDTEIADLEACRAALRGGSKSFDAAAKLLPQTVCKPAIALYAFCREADDAIDDGTGNLDWLKARLSLIYEGRPLDSPADRAFARVVEAFAIPRALPDALLEGFAWDAEGRRYSDMSALRAYAVRVAGTVGAMMAVLMGIRDPDRLAAAIDLGVAMQLSNIARDVGEDARNGRLYLPLDWLAEAHIDPDGFIADPTHSVRLGGVVERLLDAADGYYRQANAGITRLAQTACVGERLAWSDLAVGATVRHLRARGNLPDKGRVGANAAACFYRCAHPLVGLGRADALDYRSFRTIGTTGARTTLKEA